jgi:hypothetical protein
MLIVWQIYRLEKYTSLAAKVVVSVKVAPI